MFCMYVHNFEGNLIVNKSELQYYDYSIAILSTLLLALMHVPNLVVMLVWFVWRMYGVLPYSDIDTPSPADSGRRSGRESGRQKAAWVEVVASSEAKQE